MAWNVGSVSFIWCVVPPEGAEIRQIAGAVKPVPDTVELVPPSTANATGEADRTAGKGGVAAQHTWGSSKALARNPRGCMCVVDAFKRCRITLTQCYSYAYSC